MSIRIYYFVCNFGKKSVIRIHNKIALTEDKNLHLLLFSLKLHSIGLNSELSGGQFPVTIWFFNFKRMQYLIQNAFV